MKSATNLIIIIMGPPGAGKGTQAQLIADKFGLFYLEPSKIIEKKTMNAKKGESQVIDGKEYFYLEEKRKWEAGELCSPPVVSFWVQTQIKEVFKSGRGIVFAGSPRTLYEAEKIMPIIEELYGKKNIKIILLELKPEDSLYRNSHRRICELMRHTILYTPQTKNLTICPLDGSNLIRRKKLDDPETIKIRLKKYKEETYPAIDYFEENNFIVNRVDGSLPPAEVFKNILGNIK